VEKQEKLRTMNISATIVIKDDNESDTKEIRRGFQGPTLSPQLTRKQNKTFYLETKKLNISNTQR